MKKFISIFLIVFLNLAFIGFLGLAYIVYLNIKELPDYNQLANYDPPIVTRFYASDGRLLEEYAKEHRLFVPIETIPKQVINAFISAEDKNFYDHPGVDFTSILRAAIQNIINLSTNKKSLVGGSTITQQVVKNFLLTNERSLKRKIKEAVLAFRISKIYSKDRILELYLNQIYLGSGAYGVASASLAYFDKSINELSIEEAAFLGALPKAPTAFSPKKNYQRAISRRNWVISRMFEDGFITKEEAVEAIRKPIKLAKRNKSTTVTADYFAETVRQQIAEGYGAKTLYEGGLFVRTTLDPKLQNFADNAFRKGISNYDKTKGYRGAVTRFDNINNWQEKLRNLDYEKPKFFDFAVVLNITKDKLQIGVDDKVIYLDLKSLSWALGKKSLDKVFRVGDVIFVEEDHSTKTYNLRQIPKVNGGMIVMNPHTGKVLALVGGYSYEISKFNRAIQAVRQPGSAFKPFVYLSALESGKFTPSTILEDGPIAISQGPRLPLWKPKNYHGDFLGPITLRRGLELSRNTVTINLTQQLGLRNVTELVKRLGINNDPSQVYSIVLGAVETTLLKMVTAYSILVNGGQKIKPTLIERIQDKQGKTVYKSDIRSCKNCNIGTEKFKLTEVKEKFVPIVKDDKINIVDPCAAYQVISILEGAIQHTVSSRPVKNLNRTIAGKTGTTNDSKDAWFVGFTPDLVVAIYVGYDEPKTLGKRTTGATLAQPIFVDFAKDALANIADSPFRIPEGIKLVKIDYISGQPTMSEYETIYEAFRSDNAPKIIKNLETRNVNDEEDFDNRIIKDFFENNLGHNDYKENPKVKEGSSNNNLMNKIY